MNKFEIKQSALGFALSNYGGTHRNPDDVISAAAKFEAFFYAPPEAPAHLKAIVPDFEGEAA